MTPLPCIFALLAGRTEEKHSRQLERERAHLFTESLRDGTAKEVR
jgi:hypothetical protein